MTRKPLHLVAALLCAGVSSAQRWEDSLSLERAGLAAAAVGRQVLFAGGWNTSVTSDVVDVYSPADDAWSVAHLAIPRRWMAAAVTGDVALFAGGMDASFAPTGAVDLYDASTGTWSNALLSAPRYLLVAASWGDRAYFGGGAVDHPHTLSDVVDVYDLPTATWSTLQLSEARWRLAAAAAEGKVFFAGGSTPSGTITDVVDVYDVATGTWSIERLSVPRDGLAATAVGGLVLFAGGRDSSGAASDVVDVYDVAADQWSTARLSVARSALAATNAEGRAYFGGGLVQVSFEVVTGVTEVDVYDAATGTWSVLDLSQARGSLGAASVGGRAYFGGGIRDCIPECFLSDRVDAFRALIGASYCGPAVPNSTGLPARIEAYGSEQVATNDLELAALDLPPQRFGYFLAGRTQDFVSGPGGSQGDLCLGGTIGRFRSEVKSSGDAGRIVLQVDLADLPPPLPPAVQPGESWNFQHWYRDVNPGPTSNFTDGVEIDFH